MILFISCFMFSIYSKIRKYLLKKIHPFEYLICFFKCLYLGKTKKTLYESISRPRQTSYASSLILCSHLLLLCGQESDKLFDGILHRVAAQQQEYFSQHSVPCEFISLNGQDDVITPDGAMIGENRDQVIGSYESRCRMDVLAGAVRAMGLADFFHVFSFYITIFYVWFSILLKKGMGMEAVEWEWKSRQEISVWIKMLCRVKSFCFPCHHFQCVIIFKRHHLIKQKGVFNSGGSGRKNVDDRNRREKHNAQKRKFEFLYGENFWCNFRFRKKRNEK